jgi:polar amino acid transport system substrate-binding protein
VLLAVAGLLAGCAGQPLNTGPAPEVTVPLPVGASEAAGPTGAPTPADTSCGNPTASLRPTAPLPPPKTPLPGSPTMQKILSRGRLIAGVGQSTYLFGFRDPSDGHLDGFDIDIVRAIAAAIFGDPGKVEYHAVTSAGRIDALTSGQVDLVASTMTVNCARRKQIAFSTVYFDAGQRVLVERNSGINSIADLGGKKVCTAVGSTSLQNLQNVTPRPVALTVTDWTDCLVVLQQNQAAAVSTDDSILLGFAAQDPNTKLVGDRLSDEPYAIGLPQGDDDWVRYVNAVLDQIRADGRWQAGYDKWVHAGAAPPAPTYLP